MRIVAYWRAYCRIVSPRRMLAVVVLTAALAGCGSPAPAVSAVPPVAPPPAVALPWPTAAAAELQQAVDGGAQPWLLDPTEVALAYAAAAHGWDSAQVLTSTDGSTADVTGPDGTRRTLVLTQPATGGPTGIWTITTDTPSP